MGLLQKNACGATVLEDLEVEIDLRRDRFTIPKLFVETELEKQRSAAAFPAEAASALRVVTALREAVEAIDEWRSGSLCVFCA